MGKGGELGSLCSLFRARHAFRKNIYAKKPVRLGRPLVPEAMCIQEQAALPGKLAARPLWAACPRKHSRPGLSLWPGKKGMPKADMSGDRGQREQTVTEKSGRLMPQPGERYTCGELQFYKCVVTG